MDPSSVSSTRARPAPASSEADWSIEPVGAPTTSFSARWQTPTSSRRPTGRPKTSTRASPTAHSMAADEESPALVGTHETIAASPPPVSACPARDSTQAAPRA